MILKEKACISCQYCDKKLSTMMSDMIIFIDLYAANISNHERVWYARFQSIKIL